MYTWPEKSEKIIRSNSRALFGPLMDQGWDLALWVLALVSLESIEMFCVASNARDLKKPETLILH